MSNQKQFSYRWFLSFGLGIVLVGVLIALFTLTRSLATQRMRVSVDTNGTTSLAGVQLRPKIRNAAFSALGAAGVKAEVSLPAAFANSASSSKAAGTLATAYRAGLLTTNQSRHP